MTKLLLTLLLLAPAVPGPPAICFPLEIGSEAALPWGDDPFDSPAKYPLAKLSPRLEVLLDGSDNTLAHMENLRRAAIMTTAHGNAGTAAGRQAARDAALAMLRGRVLDTLLDREQGLKIDSAELGQRWFDLGFFQAGLSQMDTKGVDSGARELRHAARLRGKDGALHLGLSLGLFDFDHGRLELASLRKACELSQPGSALRRNIVVTAGLILGVKDYDGVVRKLAGSLDR